MRSLPPSLLQMPESGCAPEDEADEAEAGSYLESLGSVNENRPC
ncbi:MAG: hypothetical protein WDZ30_07505 [Cellvibrionaceae bacterium]